jgi:hypothetical protein
VGSTGTGVKVGSGVSVGMTSIVFSGGGSAVGLATGKLHPAREIKITSSTNRWENRTLFIFSPILNIYDYFGLIPLWINNRNNSIARLIDHNIQGI